MSNTLALRMASKHNRASIFIHDMSTFDKVSASMSYIVQVNEKSCRFRMAHIGMVEKTRSAYFYVHNSEVV